MSGLLFFCFCLTLLTVFLSLSLFQVTEISMGEFLMHSTVVWLNPHPSLGRMRKDPEMTVFGESAHHSCYHCGYILGNKFPIPDFWQLISWVVFISNDTVSFWHKWPNRKQFYVLNSFLCHPWMFADKCLTSRNQAYWGCFKTTPNHVQ